MEDAATEGPEVFGSAVRVGALDSGDALGVIAAAQKALHRLGDPREAELAEPLGELKPRSEGEEGGDAAGDLFVPCSDRIGVDLVVAQRLLVHFSLVQRERGRAPEEYTIETIKRTMRRRESKQKLGLGYPEARLSFFARSTASSSYSSSGSSGLQSRAGSAI